MPRPKPHNLALFSLRGKNEQGHAAIAYPLNSHLVSRLEQGELVLDVGYNIRSNSRNTLATLGRNNTDILIPGACIGRLQCSFEVDPDSGAVMLYDRSNGQTTQVHGPDAIQFEHGRLRRVVVQDDINTIIGMGGVGRDLVQFELVWHRTPDDTTAMVQNQEAACFGEDENPLHARTVDEAPTILPSQILTRVHTSGQRQLQMRYYRIGQPLGSGSYGTVYKCLDIDSGKLMAVKILTRPPSRTIEAWKEDLHRTLKREVETLAGIQHPHIVNYLASQGWNEDDVEIFMGLKEGNLASLIESGQYLPDNIAETVLFHMLQALDCLASKNIVHRDVKPENILYVSAKASNSKFRFQLGDFGLCNRVIDAKTFAGTQIYMAPEMYRKGGQTCKADVWSLFVTMLWTLNVEDFRLKSTRFQCLEELSETLISASKSHLIAGIHEMAILEPDKRASAAQILVKWFNGEGLSTPISQIPPLIPPTAVPTSAAPPGSAQAPTQMAAPRQHARPVRTRRQGPQKDGTMVQPGEDKFGRSRRKPTKAPRFDPTKR